MRELIFSIRVNVGFAEPPEGGFAPGRIQMGIGAPQPISHTLSGRPGDDERRPRASREGGQVGNLRMADGL